MEIEEYKTEQMSEKQRVDLYEELCASGLSDAEARGTAWPDIAGVADAATRDAE